MSGIPIETHDLNFDYSKTSKGIKDLNLIIPKGAIYGFLGPNGSGKTTTIRVLLGLMSPKSGKISFFGKSFAKHRIECLKRTGALIEAPSLYPHLSGHENLKIVSRYRNGKISPDHINAILNVVKLTQVKTKKVKTYSLGMKQRLGIAVALLGNPELLVLDEPTNGLDPTGIVEMRDLIVDLNKEHGMTILLSSHLLSEIEKICTHIGIISHGGLVFQGTLEGFKESTLEKFSINLETNDSDRTIALLRSNSYRVSSLRENIVSIPLQDKTETGSVIDLLRKNSIEIYQLTHSSSMEDLFLQLTNKTKKCQRENYLPMS